MINYLYKKFEEMGCDFEAEAIPDNDPGIASEKAPGMLILWLQLWNHGMKQLLGASKGKSKIYSKNMEQE